MAVIDHPIHPRTIAGVDFKYGCWNRPQFSTGYYAPNRVYREDGTYKVFQQFIKRTSSDQCQFDQIMHPEFCDGCKHIQPTKEIP